MRNEKRTLARNVMHTLHLRSRASAPGKPLQTGSPPPGEALRERERLPGILVGIRLAASFYEDKLG
jgi:hypothetical protein